MPYWTAVGKLGRVEQEPAVANHADHRAIGLGHLYAEGRRERVADVELVAGVEVRLRMVHLVVRAGVVAELRHVPDDEGVLRDAALDRLQHRVLRLVEPDVVVGDQAPRRADRLGRRGPITLAPLLEARKQRFDGRPGVAVQRDGVGLDPDQLAVVDVDVDERGGVASRGSAEREARADADHDIGGLHHIEQLRSSRAARPGVKAGAVRERMAVRDRAPCRRCS